MSKHVIITGGSRGIGKALALQFASQGCHLSLCARNEVALYQSVETLQTRFPSCTVRGRVADLSKQEEVLSFAAWCLQFAVPDVLVNNAGVFAPGQVHLEPEGQLDAQLAVNLYSAYHLTRALLPAMKQRGTGHIFNMCSIASVQAYPNGGSYGISKFALYGFSKNLREELRPAGIKVTAVLSGAVLTESWGDFDNSANRIMIPEDIARLVATAADLSPAACVEEIIIRPQQGDL
ncbi:MAG: hypothetical protein RJA57_1387 [Bacteroidota bacterium]|jgi:short-subunit dehydrogenase